MSLSRHGEQLTVNVISPDLELLKKLNSVATIGPPPYPIAAARAHDGGMATRAACGRYSGAGGSYFSALFH